MGRTYEQILAELKQFVKQRWPSWKTEAKHVGNILLGCLADQIEKQEYRLDGIESELFPDTATKYESLLRWARMSGYPVQSVQPATASLTFSIPQAVSTAITIPLGTRATTQGPVPIVFETTVAAQIPAGQTSITVTARQTESQSESYTGTGEANQVYQTDTGPVWLDSLSVTVDGVQWARVDDFLQSGATDLHYVVELQEDGTALIIFGDGVNGKAPGLNSTIAVNYKTSQGQAGNDIAAGAISIVDGVVYDASGFLVNLSVTNEAATTGGQDMEDKNHIRDSIPGWITTARRCVTKSDFAEAARAVVGVQRVLVRTKEDDASIPALTFIVYVVPVGGGSPSPELITAVMNELTVNRPKISTLVVDVRAANYLTVDVTASITVMPGYDSAEIQTNVIEAIQEFFSYDRQETDGSWAIDFGKPVYLAKLTAWVVNVTGVANVSFDVPTGDIQPDADTIPALGTVTVNVA